MCLGCGEKCEKGVGVGAMGVGVRLMSRKGRWGFKELWGEMWD